MIKNPINWNRTHQYDERSRDEDQDDNPNDDWKKLSQMQNDLTEKHSDRDSTWTEDKVPQHNIATPQPKKPAQQTQRVQQIQVQPKQQAPAQVPKKKGRRNQPSNQDDIDEQEIIQEKLAALSKEKEQYISPLLRMIDIGLSKDKPSDLTQQPGTPTQKPTHRGGVKQRQKRQERELEQLKAIQLLQQQENTDLNNENVDSPDIQETVGQLTGLQPETGAQSPGLNVWLRLKEAGLMSASNRERTEPQINEGHEDNVEEEEDQQTDEAALNQNKDY
ncbi:MAG: hypothetical protein EZS28_036624 [Streblomastix strix]|uniref:Uncharacterized protein n=1 Tax=Streblomastix strix TaxID=222440 RepID=A0A5J4UCC9_9EUKA|nr:MAG: hypothetical protein EZS28_036624 [Streblomastix strix]